MIKSERSIENESVSSLRGIAARLPGIPKPVKKERAIMWGSSCDEIARVDFLLDKGLFKSIRWEDDEPTLIRDIYDPQILDDAERRYLKMVLRPFHDGVVYVEKIQSHTIAGRAYNKEYLHIKLHDEGFTLPCFDIGKMYTGMELSNKYTLKELGITYKEGENE